MMRKDMYKYFVIRMYIVTWFAWVLFWQICQLQIWSIMCNATMLSKSCKPVSGLMIWHCCTDEQCIGSNWQPVTCLSRARSERPEYILVWCSFTNIWLFSLLLNRLHSDQIDTVWSKLKSSLSVWLNESIFRVDRVLAVDT